MLACAAPVATAGGHKTRASSTMGCAGSVALAPEHGLNTVRPRGFSSDPLLLPAQLEAHTLPWGTVPPRSFGKAFVSKAKVSGSPSPRPPKSRATDQGRLPWPGSALGSRQIQYKWKLPRIIIILSVTHIGSCTMASVVLDRVLSTCVGLLMVAGPIVTLAACIALVKVQHVLAPLTAVCEGTCRH